MLEGEHPADCYEVPLSSVFAWIKENNLKQIPNGLVGYNRYKIGLEDQNNLTYCLLFTFPFPESEGAGNKERSYFAEFPAVLRIEFRHCRHLPWEGAAGEAGGSSAQPVSQGATSAGTSSQSVHGLVAPQGFGSRHQALINEFWEMRMRPHGPS